MDNRIVIYSGVFASVTGVAVGCLTGSWILAIPLSGLAAGSPFALAYLRRLRRDRRLLLQLRQSLQSMVHSLGVGASFLQALERASQDGDPPLSGEWSTVIHAVQMGTSMAQALSDLEKRIPLSEMSWFVTAAQITQQTGGSLNGVLGTLAETLQERETFREKVAALTAQGKASGALLSALPFLMIGALAVVAPGFIQPLFKTVGGQGILVAVMVSVTLGGIVIFKIVSIKAD